MKLFLKKLLGSDEGNEAKLREKREEAHQIKNKIATDILRIKTRVDKINKNTNTKLNEISADLNATYNIAVAQGARKRGLK